MADFTSRTTLPGLTNLQMAQQTRGELMSKAASMVPDTNTLIKTLLDNYDLEAPDFSRASNQIQSLANSFTSNYRKDPYYAFTREGRRQLQGIQQAANSPALQQADVLTKKVRDTFEDNKDNMNLFNVNNGQVAVVDKDGNYKKIHIADYNPEEYQALRVQDEADLVSQRMGVLGFQKWSRGVPTYNLASERDVAQYFRNELANIGTSASKTEQDNADGTITTTTSQENNARQLQAAITGAINAMPEEMRNTMQSVYLSETGGQQPYADWLQGKAEDYKAGRDISKFNQTTGKSASLDAAQGLNDLKDETNLWEAVIRQKTPEQPFVVKTGSTGQDVPVFPGRTIPITSLINDDSSVPIITNQSGDRMKSRKLNDQSFVNTAGRNEYYMQNSNGEYIRINNIDFPEHAIIDDRNPQSASLVQMPVDPQGNLIDTDDAGRIMKGDIDNELVEKYPWMREYFELGENGNIKANLPTAHFVAMNVIAPREKGWLGKNVSTEYRQEFDEADIKPTDNSATILHYNNNTGSDEELNDWWLQTNEVYAGVTLLRVDRDMLGIAGGDKMRINRNETSLNNKLSPKAVDGYISIDIPGQVTNRNTANYAFRPK